MNAAEISPRLEINLTRLRHNAAQLCDRLGGRGIALTGVTKVTLGEPRVARALLAGGLTSLGDSRIENIRRLREAGIDAELMLLRSPQLSRIDEVVRWADISLNSELAVIRQLSEAAGRLQRNHRIVLMVELGDLREGIPLAELEAVVEQCLHLPHIELAGIGTNLTCLNGVQPDTTNMGQLSAAAQQLEQRFGLSLSIVSGGNSATLDWLHHNPDAGQINHLRLGEAIMLGRETLHGEPISGLYQDAFTLVAEVIEARKKPSVPTGHCGPNAFGQVPVIAERGEIQRSILSMGQQDIQLNGLTPAYPGFDILGASSDHLVLDSSRCPLRVGDEVRFHLNYSALLAAMTSPYVARHYIGES